MSDSAIAQLVTLILGIGGLWITYRKGQSEVAKLRVEAREKEESDEAGRAASFDKRIESYMTGLEGRIRNLYVDLEAMEQKLRDREARMEALEQKLRETRAEADTARAEARELRRQLDSVKADRDRLEIRVRQLERHADGGPHE